ncbi:MAG: Hsp33 family molecular chaperone HslO [Defluviitaleaceae bacterium]|nr:Hsp33 family molecular chaperone HslO [Defluviitaleaceae bacterium]
MKDYYLRATAAEGQIRAFAASSRYLAGEAAAVHGTTPVATAALGRTLTAAAIMGLMAGNDKDLITVSIRGNGPIGGVLATSDGLGRVKGYVLYPQGDIVPKPNGKLDVGGAIGAGHITVIKDLGLKEPYVGKLELISGEIAEDVAGYFLISEQTPTILSLGVLVGRDHSVQQAGGFLLQLMPGYDDGLIDKLETKMQGFPAITDLLAAGKSPEDVMEMLLADFGYEITENAPIEFYCNCDEERVAGVLISIGADELGQIIEEDGQAEVGCHFCNKQYRFGKDKLVGLLASLK